MARRASPFLALVLISTILLVTAWQGVSGRSIATNSNTEDKKEPEWLFKSDGRVYIPGIGIVGFPPKYQLTPQNPFTGGSGGAGTGAGSSLPGGDDTFVPNPGFEVPTPGSGGEGTGAGSSPPGRNYIPGGDDTFVPNPGFEVPIPGSGGAGTGAGSSPPGRNYVPGGDDTFVPNPGFEVPIPGSGGGVP